MKEGWERTEAASPLPTDELKELIQQVFPGKRVTHAELLGVGLSNMNYKIQLDGYRDPYVVRLYRGGSEVAKKEYAISQLVRRSVPTADFLYLDTSFGIHNGVWAVLEWKEGILLRDVMRSKDDAELASAAAAVGQALARIHAFTFPASGFFGDKLAVTQTFGMGADTFLAFMENSLFHNRCGQWLGEPLTERLWAACLAYSPLLSASREKPVLVHADFNGLNLLMNRSADDIGVSAVLDWEFAFAWSRNADLGNMLRYEPAGSIFERSLVQAYRQHGGVLEDNWYLLAKLDDLIALSDMLNHSTIMTPNRVADLKRLIAGTAELLSRSPE